MLEHAALYRESANALKLVCTHSIGMVATILLERHQKITFDRKPAA